MQNPLLPLFGLLSLLWLVFAMQLSNRFCPCSKALPSAATTALLTSVPDEAFAETGLAIIDTKKGFSVTSSKNLKFISGNCELADSAPDELLAVFQKVSNHLLSNPDRVLVLIGTYRIGEQNTCPKYKNLGEARAQLVKDIMMKFGAPPLQILIKGEQKPLQEQQGNTIDDIAYQFIHFDLDDLETRLRNGKMTLYFSKNKMKLNLNEKQLSYFNDLKLLLTNRPQTKVLVSGHTDDKGKEIWNRRLSRKRGEFVRDYLVENGIPFNRIIVKGHGSDQPLVSNETPQGRKKNRRVEVKIK